MSISIAKKTIQLSSILSLIVCIAFSIYAFHKQFFTSQEAMQMYISGFGRLGVLVFIAFQAVQVVIPLLPGGIGCLVWVLLFGPWAGFRIDFNNVKEYNQLYERG